VIRSYKDKKFIKYIPNTKYDEIVDPYLVLNNGVFKDDTKPKTILLYTTHFYSEIWKGLHPDDLDDYISKAGCPIQNCIITYDRRKISTADVVVFHGVDFGHLNFTSKHFHAITNTVRQSYQRWLFWMHETPLYYPESENYNNLFNWTMTFSRQSDIYHPYYSYTRLRDFDERPGLYTNHARNKNKKVAWMVSHCGMMRAEYVKELQKYTDITVYGLCGTSFDKMGGVCSKVESECFKELTQYKFYLSFENSFCQDYVTEKYYKFGLMYGLVPIVMGTKYDHMNSIPGSYIDVTDFSSIEELGSYINFLDNNDWAYNKYFEWRNHFKVTNGIDKICLLCSAANDVSRKAKTYSSFHSFWSTSNLCNIHNDIKHKLSKQIEHSKKIDEASS